MTTAALHEVPWAQQMAVFDTETTGVDITTARVVTAYVGLMDAHGRVRKEWHWLLDPGVEIPAKAQEVHGISTQYAQEHGQNAATGIAKIIEVLSEVLTEHTGLVIYNAPYDLGVLQHEAARYGLEPLAPPPVVVDPLILDRAVDKYRRGKRTLGFVAEHYGVELETAHDAGADARAAGRIALELAKKYQNQLAIPGPQLHEQQQQWAREQAESFEQFMRRQVDPNFTASRGWPMYE